MAGTLKDRFSIFSKIFDFIKNSGNDSVVGLSVGTSSIKLVELKKVKKSWKLLHFGMIQLPEDSIVNREIINHVTVVESLRTLSNQLNLKNRSVCTSLSGTGVIVKRMQLEVQNPKEIQDQVFWEAEQYLPFDVSEVVMDYHLISNPKDRRADVVLVAAKRVLVDSYMNVVDESGLKPKIVDLDFFALQNLYEANYPNQTAEAVAIVDIGASSLKMTIVQNGVPLFTKDSAIGGKNLTAEIQKHLNLSFSDAETLKVSGQQSGMPQEVNDLMNIMSENFASEIKRSLEFYNASSSGAPVSYVLLCGGSVKIPNLSSVVEEQLKLPTQIINPFNSISYDPNVFNDEYIGSIAPVAAIPIGLALRAGL